MSFGNRCTGWNSACRFAAVALLFVFLFLLSIKSHATIGVGFQLLLGNPSGATTNSTNFNNYLIQREVQSIGYSNQRRQPIWASWNYITSDTGSSGRSDAFAADTNLPPGFYQVQATDYSGSGYDRGHMCPSGDRTDTLPHNVQTFLMNNMIPQAPDNNQGIWANLESYSRAIAASNEVLVICGPEGFGSAVTASSGQIPIASNVWKIIVAVPLGSGSTLSRITNATRVITVNIPNIQGIRNNPWQNYLTSVNQLQTNTGFTFFTALNTNLAAVLRAKVDGSPACGITNLNPTSGLVNSSVIIRGTNLTGTTTVAFNGVNATFTLNSVNQITAIVPNTATTGPISVIAAGGLATSTNNFTVTAPVVATPPTLIIGLVANNVVLTWPTNATTFTLQQNADLTVTNWTAYSGTVTTSGTNKTTTISNVVGRLNFRLIAPAP